MADRRALLDLNRETVGACNKLHDVVDLLQVLHAMSCHPEAVEYVEEVGTLFRVAILIAQDAYTHAQAATDLSSREMTHD